MKKTLFLFATAAIALASCSSDDTIAENMGLNAANEISFRAFVQGATRAADVTTSNLSSFKVTATKTGTTATVYFTNVDFTEVGTSGTYTSATKYYWPSAYNLDFYAYAPISADVVGDGKQIVPTSDGSTYAEAAYTKFKVTPAAEAASQVDLVYARTNDWGKADVQQGTAETHKIDGDPTGVTINFRHAESKVLIKLYNSNSNIKAIVRDASICNVKTSGVFEFAAENTDGQNTGSGTTLDANQWGSQAGSGSYKVTDLSDTKYNVSAGSAAQVGADWILVPQTFTYATQYNDEDDNKAFTGPCIKVSLKIKNNGTGEAAAYIIGSDDDLNNANDDEGYVTAMWPLSAPAGGWLPGKKYTYTVDLAGGGYFEKNDKGDMALDPILDGAEIKFVTVTVDDWSPVDGSVYTGATPSTPVVP